MSPEKSRHSEYFQGILQLRMIDQNVYDWVYDTIEKDGKAKIAKEKIVPNGYDLYLDNNHYLVALGKKLKEKFAGEMVTSKRLHTRDRMTYKVLYRVTVLFRQLPFNLGDIIKTDEGEWKILHTGNQSRAQELVSGKKKMFKIHELARFVK